MKVIILEDDENKRYQLKNYVNEAFPDLHVTVAKSLQSGLRAIIKEGFDLILLDMTMPIYDIDVEENGGRIEPLAGRELMYQMQRREINIPIIVVTQYDRFGSGKGSKTVQELDHQLRQEHPQMYKGYVYYSTSFTGWKQELKKVIRSTVRTMQERA